MNHQIVPNAQACVIDEILSERARQDAKWGVQDHHPAVWMLILGEEVGEVAEEVVAGDSEYGTPLSRELLGIAQDGGACKARLEVDGVGKLNGTARALSPAELARFREEMVQVAAVALACIESVDRAAGRTQG